jgi:hypothetical protein
MTNSINEPATQLRAPAQLVSLARPFGYATGELIIGGILHGTTIVLGPKRRGPMILKRRAQLARKAYGSALYELYQCLRAHEDYGVPSTLKDVQQSPELFDGAVGGESCIDDLIAAYITMRQAERDEDAGRAVDDEPIDRLATAFDEWIASLTFEAP